MEGLLEGHYLVAVAGARGVAGVSSAPNYYCERKRKCVAELRDIYIADNFRVCEDCEEQFCDMCVDEHNGHCPGCGG